MTGADCTFCRIVAGDEPADVVWRAEPVVAFLDQRPLFPGHCLVVPERHCETLVDLPTGTAGRFLVRVQAVTRAVEETLDAGGTFVAVNNRVSQSVPHLHVHIVPRNRGDGLRGFFWPRNPYRDEQHRADVRERLRAALSRGQRLVDERRPQQDDEQ